jgi:two-component system chemotaxis response regulator CheY
VQTAQEGPSVLVVDDDECMRELVYLHLSSAGYDVTLAEDAVAALKCLLRRPPRLMISDVDMPYMNGLEFLETVKADPHTRGVAVLFLTSRTDIDDAAKARGALGCLRKPILAPQLLAAVAAAIPSERIAVNG